MVFSINRSPQWSNQPCAHGPHALHTLLLLLSLERQLLPLSPLWLPSGPRSCISLGRPGPITTPSAHGDRLCPSSQLRYPLISPKITYQESRRSCNPRKRMIQSKLGIKFRKRACSSVPKEVGVLIQVYRCFNRCSDPYS